MTTLPLSLIATSPLPLEAVALAQAPGEMADSLLLGGALHIRQQRLGSQGIGMGLVEILGRLLDRLSGGAGLVRLREWGWVGLELNVELSREVL